MKSSNQKHNLQPAINIFRTASRTDKDTTTTPSIHLRLQPTQQQINSKRIQLDLINSGKNKSRNSNGRK